MNKKELVSALASSCDSTQAQASDFLNAFTQTIIGSLKQNEEVVLPGFGKFIAKHRPAREVRVPSTGKTMMSQAKTSAQFKPSLGLKNL